MKPKPKAGPVAGAEAPQVRTLTKNVVSGSVGAMKYMNHCRSTGGFAGSIPSTLRVKVILSRRSSYQGSAIDSATMSSAGVEPWVPVASPTGSVPTVMPGTMQRLSGGGGGPEHAPEMV